MIATKRAPVEHRRPADGGPIEREPAPWAIARALSDLALRHRAIWVASAVTDVERELASRSPDGLMIEIGPGRSHSLQLLAHPPAVWATVERRMSRDLLWALTNYLWDTWRTPTFDADAHAAWDALGSFSAAYAAALAAAWERLDDPDVLLHDYQLVLVPDRLRRQLPDARIMLYLHTPWPAPDYLRILPPALRQAVLRGMLGATVVGFLARRWAANFLACVSDALSGVEVDAARGTVRHAGGETRIAAIPLGYSPAALDGPQAALPADVAAWARDRPLVVHYGRTDPIKNGPRCVSAFAAALAEADCPADAVLLLRLTNHRLEVDANRRYRDELRHAVTTTNAALGREAVRSMDDGDHGVTLACLRRADAVVVNSTVDGQNLTAFEAALSGGSGTLILSETAGAAEVLGAVSAVVSPFDIVELGREIVAALRLGPAERSSAAARRAAVARRFDSRHWIDAQLAALARPHA